MNDSVTDLCTDGHSMESKDSQLLLLPVIVNILRVITILILGIICYLSSDYVYVKHAAHNLKVLHYCHGC